MLDMGFGQNMENSILQANERDLDQLAAVFRVLADRTRIQILLTLTSGEKSVTQICDEMRLAQPTVSHHLSLLRMNNVVGHRRDGKQVMYGLDGRVECGEGGELVFNVQNHSIRIAARHEQ